MLATPKRYALALNGNATMGRSIEVILAKNFAGGRVNRQHRACCRPYSRAADWLFFWSIGSIALRRLCC